MGDAGLPVQTQLRAERIDEANRLAMQLSDVFLGETPSKTRGAVFRRLFLPFRAFIFPRCKPMRHSTSPFDFELVDYQLFQFSADLPLMRGPPPEMRNLVAGEYVVVLGAAQFFGRF